MADIPSREERDKMRRCATEDVVPWANDVLRLLDAVDALEADLDEWREGNASQTETMKRALAVMEEAQAEAARLRAALEWVHAYFERERQYDYMPMNVSADMDQANCEIIGPALAASPSEGLEAVREAIRALTLGDGHPSRQREAASRLRALFWEDPMVGVGRRGVMTTCECGTGGRERLEAIRDACRVNAKQQIAQLTAQLESRDVAIAELRAEIANLGQGLRLADSIVNHAAIVITTGIGRRAWNAAIKSYAAWEEKRRKRAKKGCEA